MTERNIYLQTIPPEEAVARAKAALDRSALLGTEVMPTHLAAGRVTAGPIYAEYSSPTFHAAAMDGIAVKADSTFMAREDASVSLNQGDGFLFVNTGNPLPEGMNAVVMIENVVQKDEVTVLIDAPAFPWQHVRRIGEDIVATELLIPQNRELMPSDIGALISAGIYDVEVREKLKTIFLPTGDEVLDFLGKPEPRAGQVIESNSQVFKAYADAWGVEMTWSTPVPDDEDTLRQAVMAGLKSGCHMVVVGAGSSAGSKDYSKRVFESIGSILAHGISVMPGKPTLLAVTDARSGHPGRLLVGAPGYPVSAIVCHEKILAPVVHWLMGKGTPERIETDMILARKTPSKAGMREAIRLAAGRIGKNIVAAPLARGAGMITTMTKAQAVTYIGEDVEGVEQGETVRAELLVPRSELDRVLVHVGSHDNTLDLLANELMGLADPLRLVSSHAGSMGGLTALKAGSALFAGAHLFDPETGDFNFPFLDRYLPGLEVTVINLAIRHQGLIVSKGNPLNIRGVADLTRDDIIFINRQRGAGTRILLDHHLKTAGINPREVAGYENEEFTHMAVAVNVLTGAASCGLGIYAAAKALDLDFVPLAHERYDLVIPTVHMQDSRIRTLIEIIRTDEVKARIGDQGGYETNLTGQTMRPGMGLTPS
ncbi:MULTISPECIES: molybdopterin biosynthesis protein [unclassified Pseudodesulfovibrio]|uniref:molybdopterin biosynthesis protein n=1 Tax=unclassified Pseudodesulfovibrio TaxID=2661612 RepID=UPI000FEBD2F3|nr:MULTISPECIES: molybdopterin biosynthesis protein [unclassified Pseudodesulfovibrio]MCJ2166221.1 molybdopterin biosynthesis protein [Pseudodesulfovibrio sp. S3-i]RWU02309.1 molybdopterin biosynthesis protein [Pseudodesulfovibrio sp. S3]